MQDKDNLLKKIQIYGFTLVDLHLYLDTHPVCKEALDMYHKYNDMLAKAKEEYAEKYGPLSLSQVKDTEKWTWVCDPWPWERGE